MEIEIRPESGQFRTWIYPAGFQGWNFEHRPLYRGNRLSGQNPAISGQGDKTGISGRILNAGPFMGNHLPSFQTLTPKNL